ncbi:hypothetical protein [Pedobacter jejuensis]|uniref:Uncharacterized protein n=1 Tax=Pedobacter jejuensis TaxID=1268550 RepID=A0A3N0BMZ7_9SPHI|nr:hypothetical protein [Pedobacter jejuensis]RNL49673.1 hypothetical protein D7004_19885 [Pedobacter jejuensis]
MNNTFNINRFGLLLKRQWLDFGKIYLISLLVVAGVLIGFYSYYIPSIERRTDNFDYDGNLDLRFRYGIFLILGFLFTSTVASGYFSILRQKSRAILELMTPASVTEKLLSGILYTALVSLTGYLIIFYIVDLGFVKYLNSNIDAFRIANPKVPEAQSITYQMFSDKNYREYLEYFFAIPFLITSIFLLGSVYFNKFHYIKTAISVMIFSGIAIYVIYKAGGILTKNMVNISHRSAHNDRDLAFLMILLVTSALTLIFWTIAYIRLKEKEV